MKHPKKAKEHTSQNVVNITITLKIIVQILSMIKTYKFHLRNIDKELFQLVDFIFAANRRVKLKESEKLDKYQDLA